MIDVLTLTATQARDLLDQNALTSVQLVEAYLAQIEKHNHQGLHLNAIISVAPRQKTLEIARRLDEERSSGHVRGALHGIPFVCKDVFTLHPDLGMPCTGGAPCLATAKARRTAPLIQHLLDSGMILLGTGNLTELCGMKYETIKPGWSPMGGQTHSPYIYGGTQMDDGFVGHSSGGGSSSGSAASVAAGFAPLAIGSECCGSLTLPSTRNAVYSLKCGLNQVNVDGALHYSDNTDYLGGMAKSADDLATFTAALMQRSEPFDLSGGLKGLKIGFVNSREWQMSEAMCKASDVDREAMDKAFQAAKEKFTAAGAVVSDDVDLPHPKENHRFEWKGKSMFYEVTIYQMRNTTFPAFFNEFEEAEVHSVAEMIKWNIDHADQCLPLEHPYQNQFYDLLHDRVTPEEHQEIREAFHRDGDDLLELLETLDVVVAFGESSLVMYTSTAQCPIAAAPLGTIQYSEENERPFGLSFAAKPGNEGLLLRVLAGFEKLYPHRPLPRPLTDARPKA